MKKWQTTFWSGENPRQELYDRLKAELIPSIGHAKTLQGECLRAFAKIEHDAYNNGGGNNHSGSLLFLRMNFPGFRPEWWDGLREYIVGGETTDDIENIIREMGEAVVTYVEASMSHLSPNVENLAVEELTKEFLNPYKKEQIPVTSWLQEERHEDEKTGHHPKIASWIVAQAVDFSKENFEGYHYHVAVNEVETLGEAVQFLAIQDGETSDVAKMRSTLAEMNRTLFQWNEERKSRMQANGLSILANHGFTLQAIGNDLAAVKDVPDVPNAQYVIEHSSRFIEDAKASDPQWQVLFRVNDGEKTNTSVVVELLTLPDLLEVYTELPRPSNSPDELNEFDTWDDARRASHNPSIKF